MKKHWLTITCLLIVFIFICLNLLIGKANISIEDIFRILVGQSEDNFAQNLILHYRLPKVITSILVGLALPIAGFLLQELFKNSLAEPSVLGITAMASLGVAIVVFLFSIIGLDYLLGNSWLTISAAMIGSLTALVLIGTFSYRVKSSTALIVLGMMLSGLAVSFIGLLQYFAPSEKIKSFLLWSFGSLTGLKWEQIFVFSLCVFTGLLLAYGTLKSLTFLLLGEKYAQTLGVNLFRLRFTLLLSTSILTAAATAFAGPIAFIGLAVPHICRNILKTSNMHYLFFSVMMMGAALMLIFSFLTDIFPFGTFPINIITSLFGTPIVISIVLKNSKSEG
ncbi:iron ABC transporter permease [uncultured Weeksella sp.]|uniref:FecCD family ABC transporter permease n=1 Tax=uncultured Weeksella sp. TaxID=1161389 RepID=UPI00259AFB39|nr:iron ABC transporter permease [uncultured Weeksella sp.]